MADITNNAPKAPLRGADIMEGAKGARNNKDYAAAANNLRLTYNPKSVRETDSVGYEFLDHHVYGYVKDEKGRDTDVMQIVYYAGEHVSNVDMALIKQLESDTELQDKGNRGLEQAGYVTSVEEPDVDAQVLS